MHFSRFYKLLLRLSRKFVTLMNVPKINKLSLNEKFTIGGDYQHFWVLQTFTKLNFSGDSEHFLNLWILVNGSRRVLDDLVNFDFFLPSSNLRLYFKTSRRFKWRIYFKTSYLFNRRIYELKRSSRFERLPGAIIYYILMERNKKRIGEWYMCNILNVLYFRKCKIYASCVCFAVMFEGWCWLVWCEIKGQNQSAFILGYVCYNFCNVDEISVCRIVHECGQGIRPYIGLKLRQRFRYQQTEGR